MRAAFAMLPAGFGNSRLNAPGARLCVVALLRAIGVLLLAQAPVLVSQVQAESTTMVRVSGEVGATMAFPSRTVPVVVVVSANASAGAGEQLQGRGDHTGRAFGREFIESSVYQLGSGGTVGGSVVLAGTIVESTAPPLIGASVKIVAETATGAIELTISAIERGPFAGQTLRFVGSGSVVVEQQ